MLHRAGRTSASTEGKEYFGTEFISRLKAEIRNPEVVYSLLYTREDDGLPVRQLRQQYNATYRRFCLGKYGCQILSTINKGSTHRIPHQFSFLSADLLVSA